MVLVWLIRRNKKQLSSPDKAKMLRVLSEYLLTQDLQANPVILSNSNISEDVDLKGLQMPFLVGIKLNYPNSRLGNANLEKANLSDSYFRDARLGNSNLRGAILTRTRIYSSSFYAADLQGADISFADMSHSGFRKSILKNANVSGTDFMRASFEEADLSGVVGLEQAKNLEYALFLRTIIDPQNKEILERLLKDRFVVRNQ